MTKQLFLALVACTLVIAPGCTKKHKAPTYRETTQITPYYEEKVEILNPEQLEQDRKHYATRGIGLTTGGSIATVAGGATAGFFGAFMPLGIRYGLFKPVIFTAVGVVVLGGGVYMLGQGIHDLAKAKKLRRIQMKDAAQKRRLEREMAYLK